MTPFALVALAEVAYLRRVRGERLSEVVGPHSSSM